MDTELDFTKLKYALYARKSTTDETRQVRSIPDQIRECRELAARINLNVIGKPLTETKSAKKPNQRPVFTQMIRDIKAGKYDGVLAWNPDRLARNMKEGGEIIDLIDQGIIKDLKFVTHHFTNDANGKMLLGMAFVLSKQYSDDLSQKVTRGVRSRFSEGLTPTPKHGYINEGGIYRPDGKNFELICEAWQKRKNGTAIEVISDHMNQNDYTRTIKKSGKRVDMDKRILSQIFHDPFYYGVLVQAGQQVDLRQLRGYNFVAAVSEADYFAVQQLNYRKILPSTQYKLTFYPLRRMVVLCYYCGRPCVVAPSTSHTSKRYLYYRCDNETCTRQKRSIRAKVIFDFIYELLAQGLNFTEQEYREYYNNLNQLTDEKRRNIRIQLHNHQGVLKQVKQELKERSLKIIEYETGSPVWKINSAKVAELDAQVTTLGEKIGKLETQLREPETDRLTIEQFLNLSKNAATIVKSADAVIKDVICRYIFLNLTVDEAKVLSYQLKEPFATLIKTRQQHASRDGQT